MSGTKSHHPFRPRAHRYALEPRQMYDGAALVEATHHSDPADAAHAAGKFQSPATEQPGHAAPAPAPSASASQQTVTIDDRTSTTQTAHSFRSESDFARASVSAGTSVSTTSKGVTVAEPSSLNAAGADRGALSGWSIVDDAGGQVTVTAVVADPGKGSLVTGTAATAIAGGYRFTGTVAEANAWLNQLTFVAADVELGNTAARTTIDVSVTDAQSHSANHSLDVTITPSNDPVSVPDASKTVLEVDGTSDHSVTVIGTDTLAASDAEVTLGTQTPRQIVYSVTDLPQYGYLTLDGNRLGAGSVFTQQDVIDGRLAYVHTATGADQDTSDGFVARVNDGATPLDRSASVHITLDIQPVNQAPTVGGKGMVYEGQPANAIDTGNVGQYIVAGTGGDPQDTALTITITSLPTHGTLYYNGVAATVGLSFDYADRNLLTYSNDGVDGVTQDSYGVSVTDRGGGTATQATTNGTIILDVHAVDDDPSLDTGSTRNATVPAAGDGDAGAYSVVLTAGMIGATDIDSPDQNLSFVTDQAGLTHGYLLLNGEKLKDGATFTMADVRAGRVQYVQTAGAAPGDQDTFHFQVVDNTTALRWNADGTTFTRIGGDYTGGTPSDTLRDYTFTINLAPTDAGNNGGFPVHDPVTADNGSTHAGVDPTGSALGTVQEGGNIVIHGTTTNGQPTDFDTTPGLSYTAQGVDPSQVVYTFLGFTNDAGIAASAGTLQKQVGGNWVDIASFGTFTQADLDAGRIRFQHDGASENFHVKANFSVTAGLITVQDGQPVVDSWTPSFDIYVTPENDLPTVTGSSSTVINEGEVAYITTGQLGLADPDDAASQGYLEGSPTLPGGGDNYAYNNDATGGHALQFIITSLPPGGTLQYSTDGGAHWQDVAVNTWLDASILTGSAGTTGLRFVSNGSEVRTASFTVEAQDRWGARSATDATVTIQITNVNDAPQIAKDPTQADPTVPTDSPNNIGGAPVNNPLTVAEGGYGLITKAMLQAYDPDSTDEQVQYTITSAPAHGSIAYSTDGGLTFHILGAGSSFTQADVAAGRIYYLNDGTEATGAAYPSAPDDRFGFTISDGDKEQAGNEFWIYTDPTNDAPTVTAPTGPIDLDSANPQHNEVPGFAVADPDLTTVGGGESDYMQVTVRLLNADGTAFHAGDYTGDGVSIGFATGSGVLVDADKDGVGDYLVLSGTRAQINAALAGLTVTFAGDRDATYQVQVIADDRMRDTSGNLIGGANGGSVNQSTTPGTGTGSGTSPVDTTTYDWYNDAVPDTSGNLSAAAVDVRASSVNEPGTISGPASVPVYEDQPTHIGGGFVVSDPESAAFDTPVTITFTVPAGMLGIGGDGVQTSATASAAGSRAVTISGDNTGTLVLTGRASDIQALLNDAANGLTYRSATNANHDTNGGADGDITLTMHFDDSGSRIGDDTGSGSVANNPADIQIALDIVAVNDAPTVSTGTGTVYLNGSTPVDGFSIGDVDYADGGGIAAGEQDFMQVTVRVTDAAGNPLAQSAYADIVLGSSTSGSSGATVDGVYDGTDAALVIRGTRDQVNAYLAGLQVSIGGALANVDNSYRVEVIADDRLRDTASGALDGSGAANGGENAATDGTQGVPTTAVDPYATVPGGLTQNVASSSRVVFPSSINNPTAIGVTAPNAADESATGVYTLSHVTLADPDVGTESVTATITLQDGFSVHDVNGVTSTSGTFGGASYTFGTDGQGHSIITITGSIDQVQATINAVGVKVPPAASGDNNAEWNGTFQVMVSVNDNGHHGSRPDQATLDGDAAANAGADPTTAGDHYGYADGSSNALVTTRVFDVTISGATQVNEAGLADGSGSQGVDGTESFALFNDLGSVTIGDPAAGAGHFVTLTLTQLQDIANVDVADRTIQTDHGTLVITGYIPGADAKHGTLVYHYSLNGPVSQPGATGSSEAIAIATRDSEGFTDSGRITVDIADDVPVASADTGSVNEDGTSISGDVVNGAAGGDHVGADATSTPVSGVAAGNAGGPVTGHVGAGVNGTYGTLTLNADGTYTYVLDNDNPTVNALKDGRTITDVYTYTITDADGDTSTTTLTITINGHTDGAPSITPVDGNGGAAGHVTVDEAGLVDHDGSQVVNGTIDLRADDGLTGISVGGVPVDAATLDALASGSTVTIDTPDGTLVLTGFQRTSSVGGVATAGTLSYTYTLDHAVSHPSGGTESIALTVTDAGGVTATGAILVDIVNDTPTANADHADVNEDGSDITGNVVGAGGTGDVPDRIGADGTATPVSGVVAGSAAGPVSGHVGTGVTGQYGTLTVNADGSYGYALDNNNPVINALKNGDTLTDVYTYTITDADGDTSTTTLTITINGHTDGAPSIAPVDGNGGATGHASVDEAGLVDHDGSQVVNGTIDLRADDGLTGISVGGVPIDAATLDALASGSTVTIDTPDGTLVLTGFQQTVSVGGVTTAGTLSYTYTLDHAVTHPLGGAEAIALTITDAGGGTATGALLIDIVNDTPTANADHADVNEDGSDITGNVVGAGGAGDVPDRIGADGTATPVSGVVAGSVAGPVSGHVGTGVTGQYGTLTVNADGSYGYTLNNDNSTVNALKDGETITDVYTYTIVDADGDASTTTLTITIHGHSDGGPSISPHDGNGAGNGVDSAGETTVWEAGLTPDGPAGQSHVATDTIAIATPDGLVSITINGRTFDVADLTALSGNPSTIVTADGVLELTGFTPNGFVGGVPTGGTLSYRYTLNGPLVQTGSEHSNSADTFALSVTDAGGTTATGDLVVNIVNDAPTARADAADVVEDGTSVTGNVVGSGAAGDLADRLGADGTVAPVSGVAAGDLGGTVSGNVGTGLAGQYGTLTLHADGSYGYTVDNSNAAVNGLRDGQTITDVYTYTITDADGDTSTTTLTITIHGHTDGAPSVAPVDGNGAAAGHATVDEAGLVAHDGSEIVSGTIDLTADDGLASVTIGGTTITAAQLNALAGGPPITIVTPDGTLLLTGFQPTADVGGVATAGTLSYTYTLDHAVSQPGATHSADHVALIVTDAGGGTAAGTLVVDIVDDAPTAHADTGSVNEDGASITGDVVNGPAGSDHIGADITSTPVSGVVAGVAGGPVSGHVGTDVAGQYGTLTLNADGTYGYALDNGNRTVNALKDGETLTDVYTYTITDADGDTSTTTLTITIHGHTDGGPSVSPAGGHDGIGGHAPVDESGLADHDGSQVVSGTIDLTADDGLDSVTVGGTTVSAAQLAALSSGSPVSIDTPDGTLLLTGFQPTATVGGVATAGTLSYTYTLNHAVSQPGGVHTPDGIALIVTDAAGIKAAGMLVVDIANDTPTAHDDSGTIVQDAGQHSTNGNVFTGSGSSHDGADRIGADGASNGGPLTGVVSANTGQGGTIGGGSHGEFGTLILNADGTYSYQLDTANPKVSALDASRTLTEVFVYTITDADGDTSEARLTITIRGTTPPMQARGNDPILPLDNDRTMHDVRQVYEPGLFVLSAVNQSQDDTLHWQNQWVTGRYDATTDLRDMSQGAENIQYVLRDGVAFSRQLLAEAHARARVALNDFGPGASPLWDDFSPFAPSRVGELEHHATPRAERPPTHVPHTAMTVPPPASTPAGAPSLTARIAAISMFKRN